jgi:hypothetical protein
MQALLSSLDEGNRRVLQEVGERGRGRLPLFPACFGEGELCMWSRRFLLFFVVADINHIGKDGANGISNEIGRRTEEKKGFV